ncbi:E3 ubiquitin-protein ligase UBR4, partial [Haematococcus lacustris]
PDHHLLLLLPALTQALPHAVAAGEAAAEFWQQLVQVAMGAAIAASSLPACTSLLNSALTLMPPLVSLLLLHEAGAAPPPCLAAAFHMQTHHQPCWLPAPTSSSKVLGDRAAANSASSTVQPWVAGGAVGAGYALSQLVALVTRLLEDLPALRALPPSLEPPHPAPSCSPALAPVSPAAQKPIRDWLPVLTWCQAGLQGLQLSSSRTVAAAEAQLSGFLGSHAFLQGGDGPRGRLVAAYMEALAAMHQGHWGTGHDQRQPPWPAWLGAREPLGACELVDTDLESISSNTHTTLRETGARAGPQLVGLGLQPGARSRLVECASASRGFAGTLPAFQLPGDEVKLPALAVRLMHRALLQQLLQAVSPLKASGPEAVLLVLDKSPSQEDFIPGSLGNAPFKSTDMGGPLMRDVKNFICRRLNLEGMVADDFGLDLLVAGNLVDLNLPILGVYREVRPLTLCPSLHLLLHPV